MSAEEETKLSSEAAHRQLDKRRDECWGHFVEHFKGKGQVNKLEVVRWGASKLLSLFHDYGLVQDLGRAREQIKKKENWEKKFAYIVLMYFKKPYDDYNTDLYAMAELNSLPQKLQVFAPEIQKLDSEQEDKSLIGEVLSKGAVFAKEGSEGQKLKFITAFVNIVFVLIKALS
jgi:hypothetical protein